MADKKIYEICDPDNDEKFYVRLTEEQYKSIDWVMNRLGINVTIDPFENITIEDVY